MEYEEGEQWCEDYREEMIDREGTDVDIEFMEVSAKDGTNIFELFHAIAEKLIEKYDVSNGIKVERGSEKARLSYDLKEEERQKAKSRLLA